MRLGRYVLKGKVPVIARNMLAWAVFLETTDRIVKQEWVDDEVRVSTVFLGLDHNFCDDGPPILFETMIFCNRADLSGTMRRYATWDEAEAGHKETVSWVAKQLAKKK